MRRHPHRRAWHGRVALVATDNGRVALVATDNGRVELPLDRKRRGENGRAGARPSLPPTFLHFYTAKAIPHDGEAPSPQCRTTARRTPLATACAAHFVRGICRHNAARRRGRTPLATACAAHFVRGICRHYSDRMRGSLRSGDMSPRMGGRNKCDPPAFLPKSISKWPNAIANRKS